MVAGRVGYVQPPLVGQADGLAPEVDDYFIPAVNDTTLPMEPMAVWRPAGYPVVTPNSAGYKSWFRISASKVRRSRISKPWM